jgi:hypothetical protein
VQGSRLRNGPARQGPREVVTAGEAEDTTLAQRHRDGHVESGPGLLALVIELVRVVEHDLAVDVAGADPDRQGVGIVAAPLPQPAARPYRGQQYGGGVGKRGAARASLVEQRAHRVGLDRSLRLAIVGQLLAMRLASCLLVVEVAAHHHDRRHETEHEHVPAVHEVGHRDGHDQRDDRHDDRQWSSVLFGGNAGQPEPRLAQRRQQAGRPVVVKRGAV